MLEHEGYPFKSKEHSLKLSVYQHSGKNMKTVRDYLGEKENFQCPDKLRYQFTEGFEIKVSDKCCYRMKKEPVKKWAKENNRTITITGMRNSEGGQRANHSCSVLKEGKLKKFHPLMVVDESFIDYMIETYQIELAALYYPPFNFERTGCKGCPYSLNLQKQLDVMKVLLPNEAKQCEMLWKPIYQEYRRIGYRLRKDIQKELF